MNVLITDDDPDLIYVIGEAVRMGGHKTWTASNGLEGAELFETLRPDLVISDINMPELDGIGLLQRIRGIDSECIFIFMTGCGREEMAIEALRLRANNYLKKPVRLEELTNLVDKYARLINERIQEKQVLGFTVRKEIEMKFGNDISILGQVAEQLVNEAGNKLNRDARFGVKLGLYELLINAVEHGNMGISGREKEHILEKGTKYLYDLYAEKRTNPEIEKKRVVVNFSFEGEKCQWTIEDGGEGFAFEKHMATIDTPNLESLHGRGVFLASFQFDELEYFGKGNTVRVTKYLNSPGRVIQ